MSAKAVCWLNMIGLQFVIQFFEHVSFKPRLKSDAEIKGENTELAYNDTITCTHTRILCICVPMTQAKRWY